MSNRKKGQHMAQKDLHACILESKHTTKQTWITECDARLHSCSICKPDVTVTVCLTNTPTELTYLMISTGQTDGVVSG